MQSKDQLSCYVPRLAARHEAGGCEGSCEDLLWGAVLFVDISGFTRLTQVLSEEGPKGVERLSQVVNRFFDSLIELLADHGGEAVKFAGDAILAVWNAGSEGD